MRRNNARTVRFNVVLPVSICVMHCTALAMHCQVYELPTRSRYVFARAIYECKHPSIHIHEINQSIHSSLNPCIHVFINPLDSSIHPSISPSKSIYPSIHVQHILVHAITALYVHWINRGSNTGSVVVIGNLADPADLTRAARGDLERSKDTTVYKISTDLL
jgi:hypothetical protein